MDTGVKSKLWSIASYIPPVFALSLYLKRTDHQVLLHARQAAMLWAIIVSIVPLAFIPILGPALATTVWLFCTYLLLRALLIAGRGLSDPLPFLGPLVEPVFNKLSTFKK